MQVTVHAANTHDTVGGCKVFEQAVQKYPSLGVFVPMQVIEKQWKYSL
ncbi:hypothetical protein [Rickettsiella endosymbiont of Dermanyssus gallinae]|nr:hypothetical protein [Rickettsiella endosymbiont of Dermanyssus gallinae]